MDGVTAALNVYGSTDCTVEGAVVLMVTIKHYTHKLSSNLLVLAYFISSVVISHSTGRL